MDESSGHRRAERTVVEHTNPAWRVAAVVLTAAAIAALGFYLEAVGHADDFATISVVAVCFTVSFWAHKRPDRVRTRFGPFGKVADAVRESLDDIRAWTYDRPLRVGFALAVGYGIALVIAKSLVVAMLGALYSWELAVFVGAAVGAVAAAPHIFASAARRLSGPPDREAEGGGE